MLKAEQAKIIKSDTFASTVVVKDRAALQEEVAAAPLDQVVATKVEQPKDISVEV
jgi:hypothetical protein